MTSLRRLLLLALFGAWGLACGDPEPTLDCSGCADDELCWYTTDFDGSLSGSGCIDWPAACDTDRTCGCVNASTGEGEGCEAMGYVQNSNACAEEEAEPVLYCVSTLG